MCTRLLVSNNEVLILFILVSGDCRSPLGGEHFIRYLIQQIEAIKFAYDWHHGQLNRGVKNTKPIRRQVISIHSAHRSLPP